MRKFGGVKRILSLFLGAMSFGPQGAYAGKGRLNKVDKGNNVGTKRCNGKVNVNGARALKIVRDAEAKGHKVNLKKVRRNKAKLTVTDENGNTVATYLIVGGATVALVSAFILWLRNLGGKEGKKVKEDDEEKGKVSDEANTKKDLLDAIHALLKQGADLKIGDLDEYEKLNFGDMCVEDLNVHMANLENSVKKSRENKRLLVRIMLKLCPAVHGMNDVDGYLDDLEDMTLDEMYKKSCSDMRVVQLYSLLNIVNGHDGKMWKLLNFNSEDDAFLNLGKWSTENITALSNAVTYWREEGFSEDFKLLDRLYNEIQHNNQKFGK